MRLQDSELRRRHPSGSGVGSASPAPAPTPAYMPSLLFGGPAKEEPSPSRQHRFAPTPQSSLDSRPRRGILSSPSTTPITAPPSSAPRSATSAASIPRRSLMDASSDDEDACQRAPLSSMSRGGSMDDSFDGDASTPLMRGANRSVNRLFSEEKTADMRLSSAVKSAAPRTPLRVSFASDEKEEDDNGAVLAPSSLNMRVSTPHPNRGSTSNNALQHWVVVYGLTSDCDLHASGLQRLLQKFQEVGDIDDYSVSAGNWVLIRYVSTAQADRALQLNGTLFSSTVIIGVTPLTPRAMRDLQISFKEDGRVHHAIGDVHVAGGVSGETMERTSREGAAGMAYRRELDTDFDAIMRPPKKRKNICQRIYEYFTVY